jgi:hypothetical protein
MSESITVRMWRTDDGTNSSGLHECGISERKDCRVLKRVRIMNAALKGLGNPRLVDVTIIAVKEAVERGEAG